MKRYESGLVVRISALESEQAAHDVNEAVSDLLAAMKELPGFPGDLFIGCEVRRYEGDDPEAETELIWPVEGE